MSDRVLKLGIPAGSLQESTAALFSRAGYNIKFDNRVTFVPATLGSGAPDYLNESAGKYINIGGIELVKNPAKGAATESANPTTPTPASATSTTSP